MGFNRRILGYVYESCAGRCYYCSVQIDPFGDWEPDHMTPRQQGGDDSLHNLVAACRACNRRKGNRTVEEYRRYLHARVLNNITQASEDLLLFSGDGPDGQLAEAYLLLDKAGNKIATADILFYGEAFDIPRKRNHMFAADFEQAMSDPSLDEGDELKLN